jgi:hypothetical protein
MAGGAGRERSVGQSLLALESDLVVGAVAVAVGAAQVDEVAVVVPTVRAVGAEKFRMDVDGE